MDFKGKRQSERKEKMKLILQREILFWILLLSQFIFLEYFSDKIPSEIPSHWDFNGNPDSYSSKYLFPVLNSILYFVLLVIPRLDPRRESYSLFAGTYYKIRLALTLFFVLIFLGVCSSYLGFVFSQAKFILISILGLFTVLGNYMKTIRPNWFMGIRTPWTLENETVWKKTHELGGKLFFYNGIIGIICCFFLELEILPFIVLVCILSASFIPVIYSYFLFKKLSKATDKI